MYDRIILSLPEDRTLYGRAVYTYVQYTPFSAKGLRARYDGVEAPVMSIAYAIELPWG